MKLFVYCAGGFGREAFDVAKRANKVLNCWEDIFFLDDEFKGTSFYSTSIFTLPQALSDFQIEDMEITIANGEPTARKSIYEKIQGHNLKLVSVVDPTAIVSWSVKMGQGVLISSHCYVSSLAVLSDNVALNTHALIGHDVVIKENSVISSAVNIAGNCIIGENTYIGMGSQIKEGTKVGANTIIGMGSVVYHDIPEGVIALGNPARPMKNNLDQKVFK
jgi:sugar O-acyltransferase (sialic acid O-acetyltransferase NeuD family)